MNKKTSILVDEPCPELLCGICSDVLADPMQVHCPEDHMFCTQCIKSHVEKEASCPICKTTLDKNSFQLSKFVQRQVSRLRIHCLYAESGCPWQGLFSDNHISDCKFQPLTCPNADKGCTTTHLNNSNIHEHLKSCLYQTMTCPNQMPLCQPFFLKDLSKHENECQSYTCPYQAEGCPFIGTLSQVNIHTQGYCGRLHQKVNDLENEVNRLNKLIQDITIGLDIKLPSTPTTIKEDEHDTSMDEMALFHQMFNSDPFGGTMTNNTSTSTTDSLATMDLSTCLPDMSFLVDNNNKQTNDNSNLNAILFDDDAATSPQPLQFVPPVNVPKRTSSGKKIRYSKNVRLAHNALRMARQRTASHNPSNDAILNNFDIAKQQQQQQQQKKITFTNIDDVNQFLNTDNNSSKKEAKKKPLPTPSPQMDIATSPPPSTPNTSANTATTTPKRRPMFILASSYLSNYNKDEKV